MPAVTRDKEDSESSSEDEHEEHPCLAWSGLSKTIPVLMFLPEAIISKDGNVFSVGERYNMAFKIVRTNSRLVRGILTSHGFHEVDPSSNDFNLMWTGSHLTPYSFPSLRDFQKVNHFPRSHELTRKDCLYKNIQRMQHAYGFKNFHIVPQTFVLPSEYQEFCNCFAKDKGPWIVKPVASSRGRGIYLVSNPNQISMDENILVSRYISNPLLIDEFKFDMRLYVLVTSYNPLLIYVYEEGLARFATVKYDQTAKNIKNKFMHLTNYSVNKKNSDYVSCDDPEVEDYGNKWSLSAVLRYLKQEGKDTTLLMQQVEELIIKAVLSAEWEIAKACKTFVPHRTNCFELYGFDVLIDSDLKPWLLEVNLSPSLACDSPLDLKIKASMIADMLSLVGFVCQDPLSRGPSANRVSMDGGLKHPSRGAQRQRLSSSGKSETEDKPGAKHRHRGSTLCLTSEEVRVLRRINEEYERRGGFIRIFPTEETWDIYGEYLESKTSMNYILARRLFHGRNVSRNAQLQVDAVDGYHAVQYERKLLSLETRKRRQRHPSHRAVAGKKKAGKESKASSTEGGGPAGGERAWEGGEGMKRALKPASDRALLAEPRKQVAMVRSGGGSAPASSQAAARAGARPGARAGAGPGVNLLNILQQGWDISKVQARMAFSSYLQRVQQRLLAESSVPVCPDKDNDQMESVIRFLRRAASTLQQDVKVVLPSRQLPIQDRRRILSQQLGEVIHCYNKETEHMVRKQERSKEGKCVNAAVFQEYITVASESDLVEVLRFYSHSREPGNCEKPKTLPVAKEDSSASESSLSTGKISSDPDIKAAPSQPPVRAPSDDQQAAVVRRAKTHPHVQAAQHCSSFPVALDCALARQQPCSAAPSSPPLHCPPPPPPPQPPSYAQSLAKSHFCPAESPSDPPAYTSAPVVMQPPRRAVVSTGSSAVFTGQPAPLLRRTPSFTSSASSSGAASSVPSAMHIYGQSLSRPTSAGQATRRNYFLQHRHRVGTPLTGLSEGNSLLMNDTDVMRRSSSSKLKPDSAGVFRGSHPLSAPAESNQQALIDALQKVADKQVARHYATSSHINLLTQHLTNLNLANRMCRESFTLGHHTLRPAAAPTQGPLKADHSGTDLLSSAGPRPPRDEEALWDEQVRDPETDVDPRQPSQGSYLRQFAIQQLQQRSRRLQEPSHQERQAQQSEQTNAPHATPPCSCHVQPYRGHGHVPACVSPVRSPKPPCGARKGQIRKTARKRLIKQMSAKGSAGGSVSSGRRLVYQAICGKTGLSVYHKLFQEQEPPRTWRKVDRRRVLPSCRPDKCLCM